jgi:transcriptional regulator with XRE-family HTH domain
MSSAKTANRGEKMRLTPFGKQARKYRIDADITLSDMAEALKVKPSYLSAVETGRKPLSDELVRKAVAYFKSIKINADDLFALADRTRKALSLENLEEDEREEVAAFARRLPDLSRSRRREVILKLRELQEE